MPLEKAKCEELCVRAYGNHKQIKQGFWEVILIDLSMKEQLGGGAGAFVKWNESPHAWDEGQWELCIDCWTSPFSIFTSRDIVCWDPPHGSVLRLDKKTLCERFSDNDCVSLENTWYNFPLSPHLTPLSGTSCQPSERLCSFFMQIFMEA